MAAAAPARGSGVALVLLVSAPWIWTTAAASGHIHDVADAPAR